jgi:uncharacterized protein
MKSSRILIVVVITILAAIGYYSLSSGPSEEDYELTLQTERKKKDEFMKISEESPFGIERPLFTALKYFEVDAKFRINAKLRPIENKKVVVLATSLGEENKYLEYAWAEFELENVQCKLLLLEVMAAGPTRGTLFLAFADATSAVETYGAGRYLDLKKVPGATTLLLDFNKSYNPYCAYVDSFSCPFPPTDNILKVAILAGEKTYH